MPGRIAHDQRMIVNVLRDNSASRNHADAPSSTPQTIVAFAPMDEPRRTTVSVRVQSVLNARGTRSFVNAADGPTKTSSSIVTPL